MCKAILKAYEAYPLTQSNRYNHELNAKRVGYQQGYEQAEKDLELTWEDMKLLQDISHEVFAEVANGCIDYYQVYPTEQSFLEEVLKRFKEHNKL
jgi:hypothetical protein